MKTLFAGSRSVWLVFGFYLVFFALNLGLKSDTSPTSRMWGALSLFSLASSVFLLIRCGWPGRNQVLISIFLGSLVYVSYFSTGAYFSFSHLQGFVLTTLAMAACFSVFNSYPSQALHLMGDRSWPGWGKSLALGLLVGVVLGVLNYFLGRQSQTPDFAITFDRFLMTLSPGILEEVGFRSVFFALCLSLLHGKIFTRSENLACWVMMILPHTLAHTPDQFIANGLVPGLMNTLMLALLFGLPFAVLQRKVNIVAAILAHATVDLIRFIYFGLPF